MVVLVMVAVVMAAVVMTVVVVVAVAMSGGVAYRSSGADHCGRCNGARPIVGLG